MKTKVGPYYWYYNVRNKIISGGFYNLVKFKSNNPLKQFKNQQKLKNLYISEITFSIWQTGIILQQEGKK